MIIQKSAITVARIDTIITYLTDHSVANAAEIARAAGLKSSRIRDYLTFLINEGTVVAEGGNRNRIYRLKSQTQAQPEDAGLRFPYHCNSLPISARQAANATS